MDQAGSSQQNRRSSSHVDASLAGCGLARTRIEGTGPRCPLSEGSSKTGASVSGSVRDTWLRAVTDSKDLPGDNIYQ